MDDMFLQGIDEFVLYEKKVGEKKTKHEKKSEKLEKLRANFKDPKLRRQRYEERRKQEKAALKKQIKGLNYLEACQYIKQKQEKKKMMKIRAQKGLEQGTPILIDMVYQDKMNDKQNKSLATQIELIMKATKRMQDPPGIHLCSVAGGTLQQLKKMRYEYWVLKSYQEDIIEVAKKLNKKPIYLSPDAPNSLQKIEHDAAYIIGGLVDRTVIKNASYNRAQELGIPTFCLPIRQLMKNRSCLNLDHIVMILNKFKETKDWKTSFEYGAPKRWKKDQTYKKQQEQKKQQSGKQEEEIKKQETI